MRLTISKSIILMIFGTINCIIKHNHGKNISLIFICSTTTSMPWTCKLQHSSEQKGRKNVNGKKNKEKGVV